MPTVSLNTVYRILYVSGLIFIGFPMGCQENALCSIISKNHKEREKISIDYDVIIDISVKMHSNIIYYILT